MGAAVVAQQVWGAKRTQYVAVNDIGEQFQKRHFDSRPGWHETTVPRETVRDELITQVTQSAASSPERTREAAASEPATFTVKPVRELQTT